MGNCLKEIDSRFLAIEIADRSFISRYTWDFVQQSKEMNATIRLHAVLLGITWVPDQIYLTSSGTAKSVSVLSTKRCAVESAYFPQLTGAYKDAR
jgi:hypothetical protein